MAQIWTELHRHLDVSTRMETLLELAQARGLEAESTSLDAFRRKILLQKPLKDLGTVLAQFILFAKVLDRPEVLERVAFEALEDCYLDGLRQVELRFSPSFVSDGGGLSWEEVLDGFERGLARGLKKYPEMKAGFLCIASREFGLEAVDRTVEFYLKNQVRFLGLDLAGDESPTPCRSYESSFKKASGVPITVHAGEGSGPENIWEAIECLGARRIGHGIACVQDPKLMDYLAKNQICLEMCPSSNWITQAVPSLDRHPLPKVLRAGIPVCINTDDPGIFGVKLSGEVEICRKQMGMSQAEVDLCFSHAEKASFLPK